MGPHAFEALASLAAGLCQDADIALARGALWAWDPTTRTLLVPDDALDRYGIDGCAGVVAHEVGHALISRYGEFVDRPAPEHLARETLNALEDPRVEEWMSRRYPGARAWIDRAHETNPDPAHAIPHIQLLLAVVREGRYLGRDQEPPPTSVEYPARVVAALERTRAARRAYVRDHLPSPSLDDAPLHALAEHEKHCAPHLADHAGRWPASSEEAWIRVLARRAFELAAAEVIPELFAVFRADADHLANAIDHDGTLGDDARAALAEGHGPAMLDVARRGLARPEPSPDARPSDASRELAERTLLEVYQGRRAASPLGTKAEIERTLGAIDPHLARTLRELARGQSDSADPPEPTDPLRAEIDACIASIEAVLAPRRRLGRRAGYASGTSLDLRRAMAQRADPGRRVDCWARTVVPTRRSAAFLLLVDLSGSMRGRKITSALGAARLFAETLARLAIPFAVLGFQDVVIEALPFGTPFDDKARATLSSLRLEVGGRRPGGNNRPAYNDDGPCLRAAAKELLARPESDRVLIVLSDGAPSGRRSSERDLHRAVHDLTQELALVGIGVGNDTEHVADFYPKHLANVPVAELPRRIGDVLRECVD